MRVYLASTTQSLNLEGRRFSHMIGECLKKGEHHVNDSVEDQSNELFHLLSLDDELKAAEGISHKKPTVTCALYCESDPFYGILSNTSNMYKWVHLLNESTIVLVPCMEAKNLLLKIGVTEADIQVFKPPVEMARYRTKREQHVFYHYFQEDENRPLVVALGDFGSTEGIEVVIEVAKKYPSYLFYYFDISKEQDSKALTKKIAHYDVKNVKFVTGVPDDIFISALINAKLFIAPSYCPLSALTLANVMASETQIIMRSQANTISYLQEGVNAYMGEYSETLVSKCCDYLNGTLSPTTRVALQQVQDATFERASYSLDRIYQEAKNLVGFGGRSR
ncbi:MAG: hypothetical protein LUC31_01700 [Coprobacillus sp.]|nr:hypothetical protein [Coprobacillus sp.]